MLMVLVLMLVALLLVASPVPCLAAWTPLIASTDFDGIKTDILTVSGGILAVMLVIIGIGLLISVLGR